MFEKNNGYIQSSNTRERFYRSMDGSIRHCRRCCFAHISDVVHNTVPVSKSAPVKLVEPADTNTKCSESDAIEYSMDRCIRSASGSVEFRGKEHRRLKLELKSKHGSGTVSYYECTSDVRIESDSSIDKVIASVQVENVRRNAIHTSLKSVDKRFGLWSDVRPSKLVFKWLPIQAVEKVENNIGGLFSLKNDSHRSSSKARETRSVMKMDNKQAGPDKDRNEELKNFICGGFAGVVSRTAVAPLDLIKTHLITSHGMHGYHKTAMEIFFEIWNKDGWRGLFRGNGVNCIRVAPCKAIELCTFEIVKKIISREGNPFRGIAAPVAGGAAGMAGTLATYPLELIRTRISLQPQKYTGAMSSILKVIREEGFSALYAGLTPSLLGVFPYAASNYFVYDGLRSAYRRATGNRHVPTGFTLLFGAVAAAASSAVTYPLEVARRQMQLGSAALVVRKSTLEVVKQIYLEEGFLALYRGLGTTWLKLVPAAGISFVCYEAARKAWELEEQRMMHRRQKK